MSGDIPENLQVIKLEPISPTTTEDKPAHNIKAKLNLHVKRRLQDYGSQQSQEDNNEQSHHGNLQSPRNTKHEGSANDNKNINKTYKDQQRQKRPYHKKVDKTKYLTGANAMQTSIAEGTTSTSQRKYKAKLKPVLTTGNPDTLTPISQDDTSSHATTLNAGTVSAGDEDEMGHDDTRPGREKEKCPDVLAMVLSMKKRKLMQDPEVQQFLARVMKVIKS